MKIQINNHKQIVALLGEEWRKLSEEQKKPYVEKSSADQKRYEQEKKECKQSKRARTYNFRRR